MVSKILLKCGLTKTQLAQLLATATWNKTVLHIMSAQVHIHVKACGTVQVSFMGNEYGVYSHSGERLS